MASGKTRIVNGFVESDVTLNGKTVVITGANTGLGYETCLDLAKRGARIIMGCRDMTRAETAKAKLLQEVPDAVILIKKLDLASLDSVRECAKDINETESRLDILINNAGIMMCPQWETKDGFEMQLGVNHIGHFLFTNLLLNLLKQSAPSRVVILSSSAHEFASIDWDDLMLKKGYNSPRAYANSKLANIYHGKELGKRLKDTGVTIYIVHPGFIHTDLQRHTHDLSHMSCFWACFTRCFFCCCAPRFISIKKGAQSTIYCAIAPELSKETGKYYTNCKETRLASFATNEEQAKKLWRMSEDWTSVS